LFSDAGRGSLAGEVGSPLSEKNAVNEPVKLDVDEILGSAPVDVETWSRALGEPGKPVLRVVSGWPTLAFVVRDPGTGAWSPRSLLVPVRAADPGYQPGAYDDVEGWSRPISEVLREIPLEVRDAVRPLPMQVAWWALVLLGKLPAALELCQSSPMLFGLLAWQCRPHGPLTPASIRAVLRRPRRESLELLGMPPRRWVLRAIDKMDSFALLSPGPAAIAEVLRSTDKKVVRWLQHLPRLRGDVLRVLRKPPLLAMASFELLVDPPVGRSRHVDLAAVLADVRQARLEGRAPPTPARFTRRSEALDAYAQVDPVDLLAAFPGRFETPTGAVVLPDEPVVHLRPLGSGGEMLEHGQAVGNCLPDQPGYFRRAHQGEGRCTR